jgi:hypothetical protein
MASWTWPSVALFAVAALTATKGAHATSFDVLELHAGYELHNHDDWHGSYGIGYTWDVFLTTPSPYPRGVLLGVRADLLHCFDCRDKIDGGALFLPALITFAKEDLSTLNWYLGLAPGAGYSQENERFFAAVEVQGALQWRSIYDGFWVRPILYASAGGAYDGYLGFGFRLAVGFSPDHGRRHPGDDGPPSPPLPGTCNPPTDADAPASDDTWVLDSCYRDNIAVRVDGADAVVRANGRDLVIVVGKGQAGTAQRVEVDIAGGVFEIQLHRR